MSQSGLSSRIDQGAVVDEGHQTWVWSVAFSPEGNSVASSSHRTIRISDLYRPVPISEGFGGHTKWVHSVSYSPLGTVLASGSMDCTIRLWDLSTGRQVDEHFMGRRNWVHSVDFSPDGRHIASGSSNSTVKIWSVQNGISACNSFKGHSYAVCSVAYSPDGTQIASGSCDSTVRLWHVECGKSVIEPIAAHKATVRSVAFSPDGSQIVSGSCDKTLRLWDTRSGKVIGNPYTGHSGFVWSVAFSPNGTYIASGSMDNTVRLWDIRTGHEINEPFQEHTGPVYSVAFSPCGTRIASGGTDKKVVIRNLLGTKPEAHYHAEPDADHDSQSLAEVGSDQVEFGHTQTINSHMSRQELFDALLDHGCTDLSTRMDPSQHGAILVSGGGFGDIWKGELHNQSKVAIKAWRAFSTKQCDYKTLKRATREIYYWSKMKHDHIHELMGVIIFKDYSFGMVSEWMENGNLHEYLRKNRKVDRIQMCVQVASGLAYMHRHNMVHGDVKAVTDISPQGTVKLTDFGLSSMSSASLAFSATSSQSGSIRWAAPELLSATECKTKRSDIYALAMTILEVFTTDVPYPQCQWDFQVMNKVTQGVLPTRPIDQLKNDKLGDTLWQLLVNCWSRNPYARPTIEEVHKVLVLISSDN
ncbi:Tyrosine kinase family catalytic domain protein [Rhizoctonia solani]|uniref:Tyrosine kinase family catalytic domain protein n=1 Tax=Rhizoctonia solani TaxID=456999 RepID=A0A8H8NYL7_9AGAM|nr:Tyrosine kinase family catalytic domain protein [Rhizoctonia solani]QRW21142.1 Tyrosine kinase family catalytic domain protein [Rhizoctonia solani]